MADMRPPKKGHYLAYKLPTLADDNEGYGLYYWNDYQVCWKESMATHSHEIKVSYWCECPLLREHEYNSKIPTVAELDAWNKVHEAVDQYNMIRTLVR